MVQLVLGISLKRFIQKSQLIQKNDQLHFVPESNYKRENTSQTSTIFQQYIEQLKTRSNFIFDTRFQPTRVIGDTFLDNGSPW